MLGIYNGIFQLLYLPKINNKETIESPIEEIPEESIQNETDEIDANASLEKAIEHYRKITEHGEELTEDKQEKLDKECEVIRNRKIVDSDHSHVAEEMISEHKILLGPPRLTRFEKARIMGARALQLSLGAPPFIDIPVSAATSLDISMKELEDRVIPITIRRVLPNGDFQNIPLIDFK